MSDALSAGRRLYISEIRSIRKATVIYLRQFGGIRISAPIYAVLAEFYELYVLVT